MTNKSCKTTLIKLCKKADLSKDECREISKKLCPKVARSEIFPKLGRLPSLPSMEEMPTLAEGLKEPKKTKGESQ